MIKFIFILLLILSIGAGVYLVSQKTGLFSKASEDGLPQGVIITNVREKSLNLVWFTKDAQKSLVLYGTNGDFSKTVADERDLKSGVQNRQSHYVLLKDLEPDKTYNFKLSTDGEVFYAKTAPSITGEAPVGHQYFGTIKNTAEKTVGDVVVFFVSGEGQLLSKLSDNQGSFTINAANYRKRDLLSYQEIAFTDLVKLFFQSGTGSSYFETLGGTNHPLDILLQDQFVPFFKIQQGNIVRAPEASGSPVASPSDSFLLRLR